ncbi:beta-1,6-N-acetylglucosaminyltransferase [Halomonas sp. KO116]|uniref:beta-1,6-N-acetylglucosaminyltransferase n=1 Tax=Halomonas sp. KO116 TaxID=1504981 RepID=UPI0004E3DAD6|nr:beta-1,6-N-acetylglucosaminyltransferase [Halomonas sp. KO116]AJY51395.1 glycosyl transferase family 14 [Halomonas sp. KO116]
MKVSFVLLAHEKPEQLKDLLGSLLSAGSNVFVHHDASSGGDLSAAVADWGYDQLPGNIYFAERVKVVWGEWSIVQATLNCMAAIQQHDVDSDYFMLISGSCMPVKPIQLLEHYLAESGQDHIEAVNAEKNKWVTAGLQKQRWSKYHFFNWRYQTFWFDWSLKLQRKLKIKRAIPLNHTAHMGSQWWCLRRSTVFSILDLYRSHPALKKFYRRTWVPDELFFQTMVANLIPNEQISDELITRYKFNNWGIPRVYYDDDYPELLGENRFFVRKVSYRAHQLRDRLARIAPLDISEFANLLEGAEAERLYLEERSAMLRGIEQHRWHSLDSSYENPYDYVKSIPNPMLILIGSEPETKYQALLELNKLQHTVVYGDLFDNTEVGAGYSHRHGLIAEPDAVTLMQHQWHQQLGDIAFQNPGKTIIFSLGDNALRYLEILRWNSDCHVIMIDRSRVAPINKALMEDLYLKSKVLHLLQNRNCELSRLSLPLVGELVASLDGKYTTSRSFNSFLRFYQAKVRWPALLSAEHNHWDFLKSIYSKIVVFVYDEEHALEGVQAFLKDKLGSELYHDPFSVASQDDNSLDWHYYLADLSHLNAKVNQGVLAFALNVSSIGYLDTLRWKRNLMVVALEDEKVQDKSASQLTFTLRGAQQVYQRAASGHAFRRLDVLMRDRRCSYAAVPPFEQRWIEEELYSFLQFSPLKVNAPLAGESIKFSAS